MYTRFRQRFITASSAIISALALQITPMPWGNLPRFAQANPQLGTQPNAQPNAQPNTGAEIAPTPCPVPTTYTLPSAQRRTIDLADWQASFEIPTNYRALRADQTIQILSPESFVHFQCRRTNQLTDGDIPIGITLNLKAGMITEAAVRRQAEQTRGSFLGETQIDGERTFVYTSYAFLYALHLSTPAPNQENTVLITAILSNEGEIFYEEAFDIIRGTFTFQD